MAAYIPPHQREETLASYAASGESFHWKITHTDVPLGHVVRWTFKLAVAWLILAAIAFLLCLCGMAILIAITGKDGPDTEHFLQK